MGSRKFTSPLLGNKQMMTISPFSCKEGPVTNEKSRQHSWRSVGRICRGHFLRLSPDGSSVWHAPLASLTRRPVDRYVATRLRALRNPTEDELSVNGLLVHLAAVLGRTWLTCRGMRLLLSGRAAGANFHKRVCCLPPECTRPVSRTGLRSPVQPTYTWVSCRATSFCARLVDDHHQGP